jgi:AraC-like DNA-binding protein
VAVSHTRRVLFTSPGVSLVDFRCRAHVEAEGPEEPNQTHSVVFVRRGVFCRARGREKVVADANHVLFFNEAEPYRFAHPLPGGDDCTILAVESAVAREVVARYSRRDAERAEAPFRIGHALSSRRAAGLHYELLASIRRLPAIAVEDLLAELIDESMRIAYGTRPGQAEDERCTPAAARRRRELVEAAKVAINAQVESLPSLGELAQRLGCSPFHLSRTFHRVCGISLRRYTMRLRLALAADRLAAGSEDLTELALELGYADHSHFTNAFRSEWGVPPARFRDRF